MDERKSTFGPSMRLLNKVTVELNFGISSNWGHKKGTHFLYANIHIL